MGREGGEMVFRHCGYNRHSYRQRQPTGVLTGFKKAAFGGR